jgi:hypothetical protein
MMEQPLRHILMLIGLALPLAVSTLGAIPSFPEESGQEILCLPDQSDAPLMDTPEAWAFQYGDSRLGRTRAHSSTAPRIHGTDLQTGFFPEAITPATLRAYALAPKAGWRMPGTLCRLLYPFHDFW